MKHKPTLSLATLFEGCSLVKKSSGVLVRSFDARLESASSSTVCTNNHKESYGN